MPNFEKRVANQIATRAGSRFWRKFIITSSTLTVAKQALTTAATGDLLILRASFQTDSTGLAGATNFEIGVNGETYGIDLPLVETVANLGASALRVAPSAGAADTTNDNGMTVTAAVPFLLEAGDNLTFSGSVAPGTGAGKVVVMIQFERLVDNADLESLYQG